MRYGTIFVFVYFYFICNQVSQYHLWRICLGLCAIGLSTLVPTAYGLALELIVDI